MSTLDVDRPMSAEEKKVIFASSLGTVFEWYDFYLYGSLAVFIGKHFFSALDPASQMIFSLLAFAAGCVASSACVAYFAGAMEYNSEMKNTAVIEHKAFHIPARRCRVLPCARFSASLTRKCQGYAP